MMLSVDGKKPSYELQADGNSGKVCNRLFSMRAKSKVECVGEEGA